MTEFEWRGYRLSTDPERLDIVMIHAFLTRSYWARGISRATVEIAIEGSLCFGVYRDHKQVGFARAITDRATFAYLADVFILEAHRRKGLAEWLMAHILEHLAHLRRIVLVTADAHPLYRKVGFTQLARPEDYMELWQPDKYQTPQ